MYICFFLFTVKAYDSTEQKNILPEFRSGILYCGDSSLSRFFHLGVKGIHKRNLHAKNCAQMCEIKQVDLKQIINPVNILKTNDRKACFPSSIRTSRSVLT